MTFASLLKARRESLHLSCEQLAGRCGLSRASLYKIESGRTDPKWSTVCLLADVLGVPVTYFRDGVIPRTKRAKT